MKTYQIQQHQNDIDWQTVPALDIDQYPWYDGGNKQATKVQLSYSTDALHLRIMAYDRYSFAQQTELNHMLVCEDSCVEFFFSPSGELGSAYVNIEINCCGTLHVSYGPSRHSRQFISLELASLIERETSIKSPVKFETRDDEFWTAELTLPFALIEELAGEKINRNTWYANFYRCGGREQPQYAVWNPVTTAEPDYHRPECFGKLEFV